MATTTADACATDAAPSVVEPEEAARAAGLRYVSDAMPGITRRRSGLGFVFVGADGRPIRRGSERVRILGLAIPPAWTDVWICPDPHGHVQATGRDARGRKQYRYHPRWREIRDETKYGRLTAFGTALPAIRRRVERDMALPDLPREKVVAAVVRLLDRTLIRVGNDEYAKDNGSYGLTTLKDHHVDVTGGTLRFQFRGKSGKVHEIEAQDARAARIVRRCRDLPGQELFQYVNGDGIPRVVGSEDVNEYLRETTGEAFTAKDFRTWGGTVLAARALAELDAPTSATEAKRSVNAAIDAVSSLLGNTRAVCRRCYVHPGIVELYEDGDLHPAWASSRARGTRWLRRDEVIVLRLLKRLAAAERSSRRHRRAVA